MELSLEGGIMGEGQSVQVEGKASPLRSPRANPGRQVIAIYLTPDPFCTQTSSSSWLQGGLKDRQKPLEDPCWLIGTPKTWQNRMCLAPFHPASSVHLHCSFRNIFLFLLFSSVSLSSWTVLCPTTVSGLIALL